MAFLDNIGSFLGNIFGGGDQQKKKQQQPIQVFQPTSGYNGSANLPFPVKASSAPDQPSQPPDNGVNLALPTKTQPASTGFPATPAKATPATTTPPSAYPNQQPLPDFLQKATAEQQRRQAAAASASPYELSGFEKAVGNLVGGIVQQPVGFVRGISQIPSAIAGEIASASSDPYLRQAGINEVKQAQQRAFGTNDESKIGQQIVGNTVGTGLLFAGPGLGTAAESVGARFIPKVSNVLLNTGLRKVVPRVVAGAPVGEAFNASANLSNNRPLGENALPAAIIGAGAEGFAGIPSLVKAGRGATTAANTVEDVINAADNKAAPGMSSTNPNRIQDAIGNNPEPAPTTTPNTQVTEPQLPPEDKTPAYQRKAEATTANEAKTVATDQAAKELGAGPSAVDVPTFQYRRQIQNVIDQGNSELNDYVNSNPNLSAEQVNTAKTEINQQVVAKIEALQKARYGEAPPAPVQTPRVATPSEQPANVTPTPNTPAEASAVAPAGAPGPANPIAPETQPQTAPTPAPGSTTNPQLPEIPAGTAEQAPAAPNTYDAIVKQLPNSKQLAGKYAQRDVVQLDNLKQQASGLIANVPDEQLIQQVASTPRELLVRDPQSFAVARASLNRLYALKDNPVAEQQVSDLLDAMGRYVSKSGQGLRIAQEEFDQMPLPMKIRYIVKKIDAANINTKDYQPIASDPAKLKEAEAIISSKLEASQRIADTIGNLETQINDGLAKIKAGQPVDLKAVVKSLKTERSNLQINNGELVKYYQTLVPGRTVGQKLLSDFPKRMMLSSFTGRVNDILTTAANVADLQARNFTQSLFAKALNKVRPGTVTEGTKGFGQLFSGAIAGARKSLGEVKGNEYVNDVSAQLRNSPDLRSGLQKARGPVGRTIQAATEAATNISSGVRDQRLYQLADKEAAQAGLTGPARQQYAELRSLVPSRQMADAADQLHLQVNNLNENPISRSLNAVSRAIDSSDSKLARSGAGGLIKNQIIPFTSWLGGNIWNSITDKNVIASTIKFGIDLTRGDTESAVTHLAQTLNGAQLYAAGYLLTKNGILTNQNAEGYSDGGVYIHAGDRYIPVGFLGFVAPNLILGNATYNGINNNGGENPVLATAKSLGGSAWNSLNLSGALGINSTFNKAYTAATTPGNNAGDALSTVFGNIAGQYIPAGTGDINAILDNYTALNPTHEKANTKVESNAILKSGKKSTAKDIQASILAQLQGRIPFASQQLPRKAGVAAPDLIDRTTHGDRATTAEKQAAATAQTVANQQADFKKRDVPDFRNPGFNDAVEARVQRKEYDKAIEGLQAQLDNQKTDKNIPESKNTALSNQIKDIQVLKNGAFDPNIRDLYKSTSVSEWRNMGDPTSDAYDPKTYQLLYDYDTRLAKAGISGSTLSKSDTKYSPKKPSAASRGRGAANRAKSNTISNVPNLSKINFGELAPQKVSAPAIPKIAQPSSSSTIKKRKISVSR